MRRGRLPNTPSQRWAANQVACLGGRRRLGKLSIGEYWRSTPNSGSRKWDLLWIITHLTFEPGTRDSPPWVRELSDRMSHGDTRRVSIHHIRALAALNGVKIPIELV